MYMKEIIDWLTGLEHGASKAYEKAASAFKDDAALCALLKELSEDEKAHFGLMRLAGESLKDSHESPSFAVFDEEFKDRVERPFAEFMASLEKGGLTKKELLNFVVVMEFSELNGLFLYAVNSIRERSKKQYASSAAVIEQHKNRIKRYIESQPEHKELLKRIGQLPRVLNEKILVVDDKGVNVRLLKAVLENEGTVETASDGAEALEKVGGSYFSAVITDVDMPRMNGIEFYGRAVEQFPRMKDRFVFFTAASDQEQLSFLRNNNLRYLLKPSPISDIRNTVRDIIKKGLYTAG